MFSVEKTPPTTVSPGNALDSDVVTAQVLTSEIAEQQELLSEPEAACVADAQRSLYALHARDRKVLTIVGERATGDALESLTRTELFEPGALLDPVVEIRMGQTPRVDVELRNGVRRAVLAEPASEHATGGARRALWLSGAGRVCRRVWGWLRSRMPRAGRMRELPSPPEFVTRVRRLALRSPAEPAVIRVSIESPHTALPEYAVVDLRGPSARVGRWNSAALSEASNSDICLLVVEEWTPATLELVASLNRSRLLVAGPPAHRAPEHIELVYLDEFPDGDRVRQIIDRESERHQTARALDAVRDAKACLASALDRARARNDSVLARAESEVVETMRTLRRTARATLARELVGAGARAVEEVLAQVPALVATQTQDGLCALGNTASRAELQTAMLGLTHSLRCAALRVGSAVSRNVDEIGRKVLVDTLVTARTDVSHLESILGGDASGFLSRASTPLWIDAGPKLAMRDSFQVSLAHMAPASSWMHSFESVRTRCISAMNEAYAHLLASGRAEALDAEPDVRGRLAHALEARVRQLDRELNEWARNRLERERVQRRRALDPAARLCQVTVQSFEDKLQASLEVDATVHGLGRCQVSEECAHASGVQLREHARHNWQETLKLGCQDLG